MQRLITQILQESLIKLESIAKRLSDDGTSGKNILLLAIKIVQKNSDQKSRAQELREAGWCLSGFTLKVKALGILRELGQFDGKFYASTAGYMNFYGEKIIRYEE